MFNCFPQHLIDMIIWAGMAQSGPWRDIVDPWAHCILKTRVLLILLTQWQAPAPKQWVLVSWDSEKSQIWAWGEFAPTSLRIQSILRHHQHFCSYPQYSFLFLPIFQDCSFLFSPISFFFYWIQFSSNPWCSQLSLATSPTSLVGCTPFCASSTSGQEYSASPKQGKNSVYRGQRESSEEMYIVCLTLLALP